MMIHTFNTPPDIHSDSSEMMKFATAFQVWMVFQHSHYIRVQRAAEVWNVTPHEIIEAAHYSPFLVVEERGLNKNHWTIGHCDEH